MPGAKIALFEGSNRIGGRLLSLTPPGAPHLRAEMGGMDYFSNQKLVRSLVENKLGLPHEVVPPGTSTLQPDPKNPVYLRGTHLHFKDLRDPKKIPYRLDPSEQRQLSKPGPPALTLVSNALAKLFPGVSDPHSLREAKLEGLPLWKWGFWNVISRTMSQEAYGFARDSLGYESVMMNFNAVDGMAELLDIGPSPTISRVTGGYQQLPLTLYKGFLATGGRVYLRYRLKSVDMVKSDGADVVKLTFAANNTGWGPSSTGDLVTLYAKKLILAMPRRSLELLDQSGPLFGNDPKAQFLRGLLESVTPLPMFKTYLCYSQPWWEGLGFKAGKAITDMPLRQCFYWGIEGERPGADKTNRNSLLMATYDDCGNEAYWGGLAKLTPPSRYPRAFSPGDQSYSVAGEWADYRTPIACPLVEELQRQLQRIHGPEVNIPDPYDAAFADWGQDPFGGAAHAWNMHVESWKLQQTMAHPLKKIPVFICGEAYSLHQGDVEGALETAEFVLETFFNLASPGWVTANPDTAMASRN